MSQQKKQVNLLLSKFDPEKQWKDQLSQSCVLISSLLENPKVDHKKLFYYIKSSHKYLPPQITIEKTKYLSPMKINNQKSTIVKSTSNLNDAELSLNLELLKLQ